jgi:hypothetical protein
MSSSRNIIWAILLTYCQAVFIIFTISLILFVAGCVHPKEYTRMYNECSQGIHKDEKDMHVMVFSNCTKAIEKKLNFKIIDNNLISYHGSINRRCAT